MGRVLVIGSTGQLARALAQHARPTAHLGRNSLDLSVEPARIETLVADAIAEAGDIVGVINAAAYTAVDAAEDDYATALVVNGNAPGAIARAARGAGLPFVHISTDYVFDGRADAPLSPDAPTNPVNAYGASKLAGEKAVADVGGPHAVLRTSWVYDGHGKNFLTTMLRLADTRDSLSVVADQIGRPTYAADLADAALSALDGLASDPSRSGIYHVSNSGEPVSWAGFADSIFDGAGKSVDVTRIPSSDYPTPAARPAYSVMDTSAFETAFDHPLPGWRDALARALATRS